MVFRLDSAGSSAFSNIAGGISNAQTQTSPDLEEISTEAIGFQTLAGEAKVRLLPTPWPSDALPPPTASLLSIASRKGLLAAAGPDSVILASTESVRQAFSSEGGGNTKSFTPQLTLPVGVRVSQVAFTADEEHLVISAEEGGGLAVYEVKTLMQGNTDSAFQLPTNGTSVRALAPNPTAEKAEVVAVVTIKGQLMMANLQTREFVAGAQGQVMKEGVSCVSWSPRGKQLVAGLADGKCFQMTPEGQGKADIPRSPGLEGDQHVSSILWLETNVFLVAYTPTPVDSESAPPTTFNVVTRDPNQGLFIFQKLPELCAPFGLNRSPPYHFLQRLKDFPPNLQDLILVASTASEDIGLFSRSRTPLSSDYPADKVTNVFTTTTMGNDSRRAAMPMPEESMDSSSPIGTALDLSAKEKVPRPLPGEEMDFSPGPLPALMILNNEGILASWWVVYADSIRQGTTYPALLAEGNQTRPQSQPSQSTPAFGSIPTPTAPTFGQSAFGAISSGPGLEVSNNTSGSLFGGGRTLGPSGGSAFGQLSSFGKSQSSWVNTSGATQPQSTQPAFGQPSFGSSTGRGGSTQGAAFGSTGGLGQKASPWGTSSSVAPQTVGSAFGQPNGLGMRSGYTLGAPATNPFGSIDTSKSPFASYTQGSSFAQAAAKVGGESPFAKSGTGASFMSTMDTDTSFGTPDKGDDTASGFSLSGFKLGSTFTGDGSTKANGPKPAAKQAGFGFGPGFGGALDEAKDSVFTPQSKEADMEDDDMALNESRSGSLSQPGKVDEAIEVKDQLSDAAPPKTGGFFGTQTQEKTTPAAVQSSAPAFPSFSKSELTAPSKPATQPTETQPPKAGGLFGTQAQERSTPAAVQTSGPAPSIFPKSTLTTTPASTPRKPAETPDSAVTPPSPEIKAEPEDAETPIGVSKSIPEAPLPPESTSKTAYAPGDSSNSSKSSPDDAPLPPDWTPARTKLQNEERPPSEDSTSPEATASPEDAPLPPDFVLPKSKSKPTEPSSEEATGLPADGDDEGWDDEGSGVDVAQEMSPTDQNQSFGVTPESSFGASFERTPLGEKMLGKGQSQPSRQNVKSLFGEAGEPSAPYLPPPTRTKESPRSPSPVRLLPPTESLRPDTARSVSAPSRGLNFMANRKAGASKPSSTLKERPSAQQQRQQNLEAILAQRTKRQEEEEQDLSDREDERVREELEAELEATKTLDDFIAHQDYVGGVTKPGIPGQIEKVYRDINSMVDTLGLNARSLSAFVKGHSELAKDGGRSMEDLEDEDWCLIEIADLSTMEGQLAGRLQNGRLQNVQEKLDASRDLRKDFAKLRTKRAEIKRFFDTKADPEQKEALRAAPLNDDYAVQQHKLRRKFADVQKSIAEVEEKITMLRTSLAAGDPNKDAPLKRPTVEAVTNTILKMTTMIEKKSGDIDVLENQMRKLCIPSINQPLNREGSSFTPEASVDQLSGLMNATSLASGTAESPFRRSIGEHGTLRKRMKSITPDEIARLKAKTNRRREVSRMVQEAFLRTGPKIRTLE